MNTLSNAGAASGTAHQRALDDNAAAYQHFLGAARGFWAKQLFQAVQRQTRQLRADSTTFDAMLAQLPTHQYFAWLERHLQRMRYAGPYGLVAHAARHRDALLATLSAPLPADMLRLDPALKAPAYYSAYDIHQHPGGLGADADALAGFVYRDATSSGVVGKPQLHERFARIATAGRKVTRVLDLGCGFGRSTHAFAEAAPDAQVEGIDLSAACLALAAHSTPEALRPRVRFAQAEAAASGLASGSYDLVTSTMLLHEMPEQAVRALIGETARLLAPGGAVVHLDFLPPADPLLRAMFAGHARRNNEPYLLEHSTIDLRAAYTRAGFKRVEAIDFAEEDGALEQAGGSAQTWRFPWKMIVAEK